MSGWLVLLLLKMAVAASVVVSCSIIAERSSPLVAALIATFPISSGPVLVFLALEHGPVFLAGSALGSMQAGLACAGFVLVHVLVAQRHGTVVSLSLAFVAWAATALAIQAAAPPFWLLCVATVVVYGALHHALRRYTGIRPSRPPLRS